MLYRQPHASLWSFCIGRVMLGNERLSQEACSEYFSAVGSKFLSPFFICRLILLNELFSLTIKKKIIIPFGKYDIAEVCDMQ